MKRDNNMLMKWNGSRALFEMDGVQYISGFLVGAKPWVMQGFIEKVDEHYDPTEDNDEDDDGILPANEKKCSEAIMRFFDEGYIVTDDRCQDFCMTCVLDGEDFEPFGDYARMERNPISADEVWNFYHAQPDDPDYIDE